MNAKRDFTEEEFKEIQSESHQFHQNFINLMSEYEEKEKRLEEQSIGLFNTFLTSVGVISGLGFAALGNVQNRTFFFVGESLLLFLIIFGLFILFSYKKSRGKHERDLGEQWQALLSPRLSLYKDFLTLKINKQKLFEESWVISTR